MTQDEAAAAFKIVYAEVDNQLLARRPKIKAYEAHHVHQNVRAAVLANYEAAKTVDDIRALAQPFIGKSPFSQFQPNPMAKTEATP